MYGFNLGEIQGLTYDIPVINVSIKRGEVSYNYTFTFNDGDEAWVLENVGMVYNADGSFYLTTRDFSETDVGDEYTINLSLPEAPTQSFTSATHEAQKSGYVIEPDVYYDGDVTLPDDGENVLITLQGNPDVEHFSEWSVTIDGNAMTYVDVQQAFLYQDSDTHDTVFFVYHNDSYIIATNQGAFYGTFAFKIQFGSASVEQNFADAVHQLLGEEVLWEDDVTEETPGTFALGLKSLVLYDVYRNGELCYLTGVTGPGTIGEANLYEYIYKDQGNYEVVLDCDVSTRTVTVYDEDAHIKIVPKTDKCFSLYGLWNDNAQAVTLPITADDMLDVIRNGYVPSLYIKYANYNAVAPIIASTYGGSLIIKCDIAPGQQISWSIDQEGIIKGTVGGIT